MSEISVDGLAKAAFKMSGLGEAIVAVVSGSSDLAKNPQGLADLAIVAGTLGVIWFTSVIILPIYYDIKLKTN